MPIPTQLEPTVLVIFGAAGDLTWRKLAPALYDLYLDNWLPRQFCVIGVDRKLMTTDAFRQRLLEGVNCFSRRGKVDKEKWTSFAGHIGEYIAGDFGDLQSFVSLAGMIADHANEWNTRVNAVFYLAVPPSIVEQIVHNLHGAGLSQDRERARIVAEKPFGRNLDTARAVNRILTAAFDESQIYRIDHYLGKETVQNILAFRFANALFEPIWDRRYIDHVQITVAENIGVAHRGGYYEHAGALRDMIQNHLMQILCLVAMEPPVSFQADEIRNKKVDVLHAVRPIPRELVHQFAVRGQYGAGWTKGERVPAYRAEPGVDPMSSTETFAAIKLFVDNWRWKDVPFYLRTGKRLVSRVSEVSIQFRPVPHQSFPPAAIEDWRPNRLAIEIQPKEGILLRFQAKRPGLEMRLNMMDMQFRYEDVFKVPPPDAYETLLLDVIVKDPTLFMRADQVDAAWTVIAPILESWEAVPPMDFPNYQAGTWGPEVSAILLAQDGRSWLQPVVPDEESKEGVGSC